MRYVLLSALLLAILGACSAFTVDVNGGRIRMRREAEEAGTGERSVESENTDDIGDSEETESTEETAESESSEETSESESSEETSESESSEETSESESSEETSESESTEETDESESTEETSESESTEETSDSESSEETSESESSEETVESESSEETAESESSEETVESESSEETDESESTDDTSESESTEETSDSESSEKTSESESSEETVESESSEETAESESSEETDESESTEETSESESTEETSDSESSEDTAESESSEDTAESESTEETDESSESEDSAGNSAGSDAPESPEAELEVAVNEEDPSASSSEETEEKKLKLSKCETTSTEEAGEDDTGKPDPVEEAGKGKGASGDGSGLVEEEDEETALNENGVINVRPANTEAVAAKESSMEAKVQAKELEEVMTGEDLDDPKGGDEDGDREEDEDSEDTDDSSTGDNDESTGDVEVVAESDQGDETDSSDESADDVEIAAESDESVQTDSSDESADDVEVAAESDDGAASSDESTEDGDVVAASDDGYNTGNSDDTADDEEDAAGSDDGENCEKSTDDVEVVAESDDGDNTGSDNGEDNLTAESDDNPDGETETESDSEEPVAQSETEDIETSESEEPVAQSETEDIETSESEEPVAQSETEETETSDSEEPVAQSETEETETSDSEEPVAQSETEETETSDSEEPVAESETEETETSDSEELAAESESEETETSDSEEPIAESETEETETSDSEELAAESETEETETSETETEETDSDSEESSSQDEAEEPADPEETPDEDGGEEDASDDSSSSETNGKRRKKRLALADPKYIWKDAIFPFKYKDGLADRIKLEARAAMGYLARHTCMEFVPYEGPQTNTELGLGHPGHLIFTNEGGCWSYMGLMNRARGQEVSCMSRTVFIHELGHSAFLLHEQNGDNRKGLIRINYDNILDDLKDQYIQMPSSQTLNYTGYDVSSLIHYPIGMNSKNGKQTMSILYEAPDFQVGGHLYYVAAEINIGYKCKEKECPDFTTKCVKDSYVVKRDGKCMCECTRGVDPESGCADPKKEPNKVAGWGPGKLSMLKPKVGCPEGMKEKVIEHEGDAAGSASTVFHLAAAMGAKSTLPLCVSDGGEGKWPMGRYCLINEGDSCPKDFEAGSFTLGQKSGGNTVLKFCCKDDGFNFEDIPIKNEKPFTFFRLHKSCQNVEDMYAYEERITLDSTTTIVADGKTPVSQIRGSDHALTLFVCYYVPLQYGCGAAIDLTPENPTGTLSTPNYPQNYPKSTQCTWLVTGSEKDSVIVIDFDDKTFCLESGDHVDIHYNKIGQPSLRNTGKGYKPSVVTLYNTAKIQFRSDLETECSGFKATVRMATKEEQAFSIADEGASYRGTIGFTHNTIPCLPWSQMTECPHHPFAPGDAGDGLESNYCRNPGDGIAPWCYVSHDNCERNYCDVSLIGRPADNYPDCKELIAANSDFCKDQDQAMRGCFKSCLSEIKYDSKPKKVTKVTCPKPDAINDAEIIDVKDSYKMGEKALYKCTAGEGELTRTCTSTGEWTPGGYVCGDCPTDWIPHHGYCYYFFDTPVAYAVAEETCHSYDAYVAAIKSQEDSDFIERISRPTSPQWLGMKRKGKSKTDFEWDIDKELVGSNGYSNWYKGIPHKNKKRQNAYSRGSNKDMTWRAQRSKSHKPLFPFTCQKVMPDNIPCVDRLPNCGALVVETPEACHNYSGTGWVEQQCRKTCGACGKMASCTIPGPGANAHVLTEGTLVTGEVAYYECEEGYTVSKGSLIAACLPSGKMSSDPPECVEKGSTIRPSNNNDIRPRGGTFGSYVSFTGYDDMYMIDAPGKVIAWEFYLSFAGTTAFQIWRPTDDPASFTLVGQNSISATAVRRHVVNIPAGEQIEVEAGDRIGVYNPYERAGISYDTNRAKGEGSLKLASQVWYASDFVINNDYEFKESSPLRIMSFRAILGPK